MVKTPEVLVDSGVFTIKDLPVDRVIEKGLKNAPSKYSLGVFTR